MVIAIINNISYTSMPQSFNSVIKAYALSKTYVQRKAILAFNTMRTCGAIPNEYTFPFLFKACSAFTGLREGKQIHAVVIKHGLDCNVYVQNSMIHFYGSCKNFFDCCKVFDKMSMRSIASWNSIICACVDCFRFGRGFEYFWRMRVSGICPDETTMVVLLSACGEVGNLSLGRLVHSQVIVSGMDLSVKLGTSIVDMYGKCGAVDSARLVFDWMSLRSVWTWSAVIHGLAKHGFSAEALEYFSNMRLSNVPPNHVTFLGVLCACSHAGLVEEGKRFFHEMKHIHKIKPQLTHYSSMVGMFGRAGQLLEAYDFILRMPVKPDATIWRALLSVCSVHDVNDISGIGKTASKKLLELEPTKYNNFVMVANRHAKVGSWEKAAQIRSEIRNRGLNKPPGESCLETCGSITRFFSRY